MTQTSRSRDNEGVVKVLVVLGTIMTVIVSALVTGGYSGYSPNPQEWVVSIIIPLVMLIGVTAYYSEGSHENK